jgi:shikimate dehydrogenase
MAKFALIGNPIKHSLSPALFKIAYRGNTDEYELIETQSVEEAMQKVHYGGYSGVNVTAPFKESVMQYVTKPDTVTSILNAANTLIFKAGEVYSYSTDYWAVRRIINKYLLSRRPLPEGAGISAQSALNHKILQRGAEPQNMRAALCIVCAGAGKAAALALVDSGFKTIIANRSIDKAKEFATKIGAEFAGLNEVADIVKRVCLVVYALPLTIEELKESDLSGVLLIEANYKNPSFPNAPNYIGGLEWLVNQAIPGFELFTGRKPDAERMRSFAESII